MSKRAMVGGSAMGAAAGIIIVEPSELEDALGSGDGLKLGVGLALALGLGVGSGA